ncbi:Nudix hydrolase 26, chloroplastic-like protein [Drosera capensis]
MPEDEDLLRMMAISRMILSDATQLAQSILLKKTSPKTTKPPLDPSKFTILPLRRPHLPPPSLCTSSMEAPPPGYRKNVGICLINPAKKIFAASRLDLPDSWQMPQGGIDDNEDPKTAAFRELKEETGVTSAEYVAEVPHWLTYDFPPEVGERLRRRWGSNWKGQAQKWFLLNFVGDESEINLLGDGNEKPEFGQWSWISPERMVQLSVDFKRPVYEEVFTVFAPYLQ